MLSSMSLHSSVRRTAGHFHRGHHFPYSPVHSTHPAWPELLNSWFIVHLKKLNRLNFYITVNSSKFPVQYKKKKKKVLRFKTKAYISNTLIGSARKTRSSDYKSSLLPGLLWYLQHSARLFRSQESLSFC